MEKNDEEKIISSKKKNNETIDLIKGIKVNNFYYKLANVISRVVLFFQKYVKYYTKINFIFFVFLHQFYR